MGIDPGRHDEFDELLKSHLGIIRKVTNAWGRKETDRDDLAQEILVQLWRSFNTWDRSRKFSTWMYRVALNVAISFSRKNNRQTIVSLDDRIEEVAVHTDSDPEWREQVGELYRFIDDLDPLHRALVLLYLDDNSYREIADVLGITETNVATKISRLKKQMSNKLNPLS